MQSPAKTGHDYLFTLVTCVDTPAFSQASPSFTVDYATSFRSKSTFEIARAYMLLQAGGIPLVVKHAKSLLDGGRRLAGDKLVDFGLRHTFAAQFTGGEDLDDLGPNVTKMNDHGALARGPSCRDHPMMGLGAATRGACCLTRG